MKPQGHIQGVMNLLDFGRTPRQQWTGGRRISVEHGYSTHLLRDPVTDVLCGGTEPRTDSAMVVP